MKRLTGFGLVLAGVIALPALPADASGLLSKGSAGGQGATELIARGGGGGGGRGGGGGGGGGANRGGGNRGGGGGNRAHSGFNGSGGGGGFNRGSSRPSGGWSNSSRGNRGGGGPSLESRRDSRPASRPSGSRDRVGAGSIGNRTPGARTPGDRTVGDRNLGDRTVGDRTVGNRTVGDRTVGDRGLNRDGSRSLTQGDRSFTGGDRTINRGDRSFNRNVDRDWNREINIGDVDLNPGWARPGWGLARPWATGWYGGWATPAWGWWGARAAAWGVGTLATAAIINDAVDAAVDNQTTYIVVPNTSYQLLYGTVQPSGTDGVSFDVTADGSTYQLSADCKSGMLNGREPNTAQEAELLNAACQVAYGST